MTFVPIRQRIPLFYTKITMQLARKSAGGISPKTISPKSEAKKLTEFINNLRN